MGNQHCCTVTVKQRCNDLCDLTLWSFTQSGFTIKMFCVCHKTFYFILDIQLVWRCVFRFACLWCWPRGFFASHSLFSCNWSVYVCGCACCLFTRDGVSCQCGGVNLLHSHFQTVFVFCTCCCLMFELTLAFYLFLTLNLSFYDICSVLFTQMYHGNSPCGVFWDSRLCRVSQSKLMPANGTLRCLGHLIRMPPPLWGFPGTPTRRASWGRLAGMVVSHFACLCLCVWTVFCLIKCLNWLCYLHVSKGTNETRPLRWFKETCYIQTWIKNFCTLCQ